jgi:hypothetical protein
VSECDRETSTMRRFRSTEGLLHHENKMVNICSAIIKIHDINAGRGRGGRILGASLLILGLAVVDCEIHAPASLLPEKWS